jgi:hypothetical protein
MIAKNMHQTWFVWDDYVVLVQSLDLWNIGKWVEQNAMRIIAPNRRELMERAEIMIFYLENVARGEDNIAEHNEYIVPPQWLHQFLDELRKIGENVSSFRERLNAIQVLIFFRDTEIALFFSEMYPSNGKYIPESIQANIDLLRRSIVEVRELELQYRNDWNTPQPIRDRINQLNEINPDIWKFQQRLDFIRPTMLRKLTEEALSALERTPIHPGFFLDKIQSLIDQMNKLENDDLEPIQLMIVDFQSRLDKLTPVVLMALLNEEVNFLELCLEVKLEGTIFYTKDKVNALITKARLVNVDTSELQRRLSVIPV